ncbi:hypothetical protein EON63_15630 [archaeon]|nr:MAG: hypothetical protein EON63_15630 [archaeon]
MEYDIDELPHLESLPKCPEDERYTQSFNLDMDPPEDIQAFFHQYGFVVMRDVYSASDCEASRGAIWEILEKQNEGLDRADPSTWTKLKTKGTHTSCHHVH